MRMKTDERITLLLANPNMTEEELVLLLKFKNANCFRNWKSTHRAKITNRLEKKSNRTEKKSNPQEEKRTTKKDSSTPKPKPAKKVEEVSKLKNSNPTGKKSNRLVKNTNQLVIPTFDEVVSHLRNQPDHVHHQYFMKEIKRGKGVKPLIIDNQGLLMKYADVIRGMVN